MLAGNFTCWLFIQPPGFKSKEYDDREQQQDYSYDTLGEFLYLKHGEAYSWNDRLMLIAKGMKWTV
jgi:hypothetical protein